MIIKNYLSTKQQNSKILNSKPRSVKEQKIEYLRIIKNKLNIAHFCNSKEAKEIIELGLQKKLINENQLIIIHNSNNPKGSKKIQKLSSKLNLKGIEDIFCWSTGEKDGSSVDLLYQILKKLKPRIHIHDETFFMGRRKKRFHVYRNLKYSLGGESHVPSHFANDDYIDLLKSITNNAHREIIHMDICAGQGSIGFSLFNETKIKKLYCVEINPREVEHMKKTIKYNKLNPSQIDVVNSNVLESFPKNAKVDLVSANPPHTNRKAKNRADLQGADEDWHFHKTFFLTIGKYLNKGGLVTLLENGATSSPKDFKPLIPSNLQLFKIQKINHTPWYILFIKKKGEKCFYQKMS